MVETKDIVMDTLKKQRGGWLTAILAVLVALYGITTAGAAYLANVADGKANDAYFNGVALLNDANGSFLTAVIVVIDDNRILDETAILQSQGADPDLIAFIEGALSIEADEAIARSGFLDDTYTDAIFGTSDELYALGDEQFDLAEEHNITADGFQVVVLILAVGLSFVAWASLGERVTLIRVVFVIMAAIIYVVGVISLLVTWLFSPVPLFGV